MSICTVICRECRAVMRGADVRAIDFRNVVRSGRIIPLCPRCYDEQRTRKRKKKSVTQGGLFDGRNQR